jgi:protein TonB
MTRWALTVTPLSGALALSVTLHAGLILLRWADPSGFDRLMNPTPLEVVLVNGRSNGPAPAKPQALAQTHLQGGGDAASGRSQSPLPLSTRTQDGQNQDLSQAQIQQMKAQQTALLTQIKKQLADASPQSSDTPAQAAEREQQRKQMLDWLASIEQRIQAQNARPRTRYIGPATQGVSYAIYQNHMQRLIEERGTRHFPVVNGQKLYGTLTLVLTVNAQGQVVSAQVLKSSGLPALDKAAIDIAASAGPFGLFTQEMKQSFDQLALVSRYTFKRNNTLEANASEP